MNPQDTQILSGETVEVDIKKVDYTKSYEYGPSCTMHILGRTKGGTRVHIKDPEFDPYFYVPYEEFDSELESHDYVTDWERGYENIEQREMVRVYTRIPGDVPQLRDDYDHHEADILFPNRYLIDNDIEDAIEIPVEHANPEPTELSVEDMEPTTCDVETRICFCDIEVYNKYGFPNEDEGDMKVTSIVVYDNFLDEYRAYLHHPDTPLVNNDKAEVFVYEDEMEMLLDFCSYVVERNFDVFAGWNFTDFDSKYLINRLETLNDKREDDKINKDKISYLDSAYDDGWFGGKIKGISVFDMYMAYENLQFTELDSFALDSVAEEEMGISKVSHDRGLWELWEEDPEELIEYNVRDVELTVKLEEQEDIIKFYEAMATYVGGRLAEVIDPSNAVGIRVLRQVNEKFAVPSARNVDGEEFEGAEVFDPITGIRDNVVVLDLKSLYPMSMKTINAGPRTKDPDGDIVAPNDVSFTKEKKSIVVDIIDELLEEREQLKDERDSYKKGSQQYDKYDRQQRAVKIVMNTLYGVLGWDRFRLYDQDVGAAVTAVGREVIKFTEEVVEDMGYEVTYGDTDSVMIELGEDISHDKALEIGHDMEEKINSAYDDFAEEEFNVEDHYFQIEFEKLYRKYFQAGKKKRYAGHIVWKEGQETDDTDIVGFETERSDYSGKAKELLKKVFNEILGGGDIHEVSEVVNNTIDSLKEGKVDPDDFGIPSSVSKDFDDYDSPTLAVRGSEWSNEAFNAGIQPGDKPKGMYVSRVLPNGELDDDVGNPPSISSGAMYICWMDFNDVPDCFEWDWETYIDKQMKSPIQRILKGTDWTWQEVRSGNVQPSLTEYDFEDNGNDNTEVVDVSSEDEDDDDIENIELELEDDVADEGQVKRELVEAQSELSNYDGGDGDGEVIIASTEQQEEGDAELKQFMEMD